MAHFDFVPTMDKRRKSRGSSRREKRKSHVQEQLSRQQAELERKRLEENRGKLQRSDFLCNYEFRNQCAPLAGPGAAWGAGSRRDAPPGCRPSPAGPS